MRLLLSTPALDERAAVASGPLRLLKALASGDGRRLEAVIVIS